MRFQRSLPRPAASASGGGASGPARVSSRLAPFRWAPGTPRVCRGPAARAARAAEFAVSPPLRPGFSPLPRLLPPPSARFLEPPSGLQLRAEPQRQHIRASSTSVCVCFLNRENPFPQMGGSRASLLRGVGPAAPPSAPQRPRLGVGPACCAHCISPNGLADDSTSFSLKAAPRFSPLLRLRLRGPRRPLRGAPAALSSQDRRSLQTRLLEPEPPRRACSRLERSALPGAGARAGSGEGLRQFGTLGDLGA